MDEPPHRDRVHAIPLQNSETYSTRGDALLTQQAQRFLQHEKKTNPDVKHVEHIVDGLLIAATHPGYQELMGIEVYVDA